MIERRSPVARIAGVTQSYGHVIALDDVSIEIPAGGMVGFIGPDGVGKSTLLSLDRRLAADPVRKRFRPRRRHGEARRIGPRSARASPICRRAWARTSMPTSASGRISSFSAACSGNRVRERDDKIGELLRQHGARALFRPPGEETVRRHAAEARALLLPHP